MLRHALFAILVSALPLVACDLGGSGGGGGNGGSGSGDINEDIPCGQIIDCFGLCDQGDDACGQDCYDAAYPEGQDLFDEASACADANGCTDAWCIEERCGSELQACEVDLPPGGQVCVAEGAYEVCDGAWCTPYSAMGGGWGTNEQAAAFWGTYDCEEFMLNMMTLHSWDASVRVLESCEVTFCESNNE